MKPNCHSSGTLEVDLLPFIKKHQEEKDFCSATLE